MTIDLTAKLSSYPALSHLVARQLAVWPDHIKYMEARFGDDDAEFLACSEKVSELVLKLVKDELDAFCESYKLMCLNFNAEQLFFKRHKRYRFSTFEEAFSNVYGNDEYMGRYVQGILLSQVFWRNHAQAMDHYRRVFLPSAPAGYKHLEVGPGHGLFLYFASSDPRAGFLEAWELSAASIAATRACLDLFDVTNRVNLVHSDVLKAQDRAEFFDTIILSEVLEHLEQPEVALETLRRSLKPNGRLLINVPINSPAPDHIYLWPSIEEVDSFVQECGFESVRSEYYPVTGYSLEQAFKRRIGVSCVLTLRKVR